MKQLNNEELDKVNGGFDPGDPLAPMYRIYRIDSSGNRTPVGDIYETYEEAQAALDAMISKDPSLKGKRGIAFAH